MRQPARLAPLLVLLALVALPGGGWAQDETAPAEGEAPFVEIALDDLPRLDFGPQGSTLTEAYQIDRYGFALLLPAGWAMDEDEEGIFLNAPGHNDGAGLQFYEAYDVVPEDFHAYMTEAIVEDPEIAIAGWYGGLIDGALMPFMDLTITLAPEPEEGGEGATPQPPVVARQLIGMIALPEAVPVIVICGARQERWAEFQTTFLAILGSIVAVPSEESQAFEELEEAAGAPQ